MKDKVMQDSKKILKEAIELMIKLNSVEMKEYKEHIEVILLRAKPGIYYFGDFFPDRTASPRLARYLFEQVQSKHYPNVRLVGSTSAEGYLVK